MSEEDVAFVFGPPHVRRELDRLRSDHRHAEKLILAYRRRLLEDHPWFARSEYDGLEWEQLEDTWMKFQQGIEVEP